MKVTFHYKNAPQKAQAESVAVVTVPSKKGAEFPQLPRFVQSCLQQQNSRPKKDDQKGSKPLSDAQIRRAVKWFEALCRIESLIAATDATSFAIENGYLIGSYLLGQIERVVPNSTVRFVGFDKADWPLLKDVEGESGIVITVYHKQAEASEEKRVVIPVFAEKSRISLPQFVVDAVDPKTELSGDERRRMLVMFRFWTFLAELQSLGAKAALVQGCVSLDPKLVKALATSFKKTEYIGFPEDYFASVKAAAHPPVSLEKLTALKEKFAA